MKTKKIISRIYGGLGNQLFCYAAARRLAIINNAELVLDDISGFTYDVVYRRSFQLDHFNIDCRKATSVELLQPFSKFRRALKRKWNKFLPFNMRVYLAQEGVDYDPRLLTFKARGAVYLEGYWQSERYFSDVESIIRRDLEIKPPIDTVNLKMADKILNCNSIAVHVRFFDNPSIKGVNNISTDYYRRAVTLMDSHVNNAHYFIFSDQPDSARNEIPLSHDRYTMVCHNQGDLNAYADLWLMKLCKHCIIANSTFSWWGAWLNENKKKIIVAPGFEKRSGKSSWGFIGLLPDSWIKIS